MSQVSAELCSTFHSEEGKREDWLSSSSGEMGREGDLLK
jgi:hypothetical protein